MFLRTLMNYQNLRKPALVILCREKGIKRYSALNKAGLLNLLQEYDKALALPAPAPAPAATTLRSAGDAVNLSDIDTFFQTSSREENGAVNDVRETILSIIYDAPREFVEHETYGEKWRRVQHAWTKVIQQIAERIYIPLYDSVVVKKLGGRGKHHDHVITYYHQKREIASQNIEFKKGGTSIHDQPQFLSLPVSFGLFATTYDIFWYGHYLDKYLACDAGITETKPSLEDYLREVKKDTSSRPFFQQLKTREEESKKEKFEVVNQSITDFLTQFGASLDITGFLEKVRESQTSKLFLLWSKDTFHLDEIVEDEMSSLSFHSIKNGNVLVLQADKCHTQYELLLRWRNHKGILNPAWQIRLKRVCKSGGE